MAQIRNITILASKRLTQSFQKVPYRNTWQSLSLTKEEAQRTLRVALRKMDKNSKPLTITVTVN